MLSCFSCVQLFATVRAVACQAPLSMEFSRQEYWSRLSFPSSGDLPEPGYAFLIFVCLFVFGMACGFFVENWIFKYNDIIILEMRFSPFPRACCFMFLLWCGFILGCV